MTATTSKHSDRVLNAAVLVAALGYFVDIYDLILFSIVRRSSLLAVGVPARELLDRGVLLLNMQMTGMLVGGLLWGILGDRRGRLSTLFGSIVLYSAANLANAFVHDLTTYAVVRFIAGVGLAGELGAGVTLASELLSRHKRGYGTTLIAGVGLLGGVTAGLVGDRVPWRTAYIIGGCLGIALLVLRIGVSESRMFDDVRKSGVSRGNVFLLFTQWARARRFVAIILVGIPIWFVAGILVTFCPEFGRAMHMTSVPTAARAVLWFYAGLAVGDFSSGTLSQLVRSRKRVLFGALVVTIVGIALYFTIASRSLTSFYGVCLFLGIGNGYWAVFVTVAAEQFGTNLRATAATSIPNLVRGSVPLLTMSFQFAKRRIGILNGAIVVGAVTLVLAFAALWLLDETFGKDLNFVES